MFVYLNCIVSCKFVYFHYAFIFKSYINMHFEGVFKVTHTYKDNTFLVHNNFDICIVLSSAYRSQLQTPIPFPLKVMKPKRTSSLHKICFTNHTYTYLRKWYAHCDRICPRMIEVRFAIKMHSHSFAKEPNSFKNFCAPILHTKRCRNIVWTFFLLII